MLHVVRDAPARVGIGRVPCRRAPRFLGSHRAQGAGRRQGTGWRAWRSGRRRPPRAARPPGPTRRLRPGGRARSTRVARTPGPRRPCRPSGPTRRPGTDGDPGGTGPGRAGGPTRSGRRRRIGRPGGPERPTGTAGSPGATGPARGNRAGRATRSGGAVGTRGAGCFPGDSGKRRHALGERRQHCRCDLLGHRGMPRRARAARRRSVAHEHRDVPQWALARRRRRVLCVLGDVVDGDGCRPPGLRIGKQRDDHGIRALLCVSSGRACTQRVLSTQGKDRRRAGTQ